MHSCAPLHIIQCTRDVSYNPSDLNHLLQDEEFPQNKQNHTFAHCNMYTCGNLSTLVIHIHRNGMITLGKVVIILIKLYYKQDFQQLEHPCQFKMISQHAVLTYITTKNEHKYTFAASLIAKKVDSLLHCILNLLAKEWVHFVQL